MPTVEAARRFFRGTSVNVSVRAALARLLASFIPAEAVSVLDVGCGDGKMSEFLAYFRPGTKMTATDVEPDRRPSCDIPFVLSRHDALPFPDRSFDALILFNVLHHAVSPAILLAEAKRVSRGPIIIKDHVHSGPLAVPALTLLDWLGNVPQGRSARATYASMDEWKALLGAAPRVARYPLDSGAFIYDALFAHLNVVFVLEPR